MSRFCFFVQHCLWQVVCIRWDSIQSGEKEKNGNLVVKFQYFCHSPTSQVFPSSSQMCAKQCSSSNVTRISIWRPRCQTDDKKAWSSKPPPIPNLWEHQAQATNTKKYNMNIYLYWPACRLCLRKQKGDLSPWWWEEQSSSSSNVSFLQEKWPIVV